MESLDLNNIKVLEFEFGKLKLLDDRILTFRANKPKLCLDEHKSIIEQSETLTKGRRLPYLVDKRNNHQAIDSNSKSYLAKNLHKYVTCVAVIEDSALIRFLVHTFISMYRPKVPMQLFKDKNLAIKWLLRHEKDKH